MTDRTRPTATSKRQSRRRSLYRHVLSLAVAAIVAAWLPFSVMYVSAVHRPPAPVATLSGPSHGATRLVTTASGATKVVSASANGSRGARAPATAPLTAPVSTHAS
ncbi:MAG TPA: hypothetical protein VFW09_16290 [Solirubrobacteraceae bacterium]|jgi:hypothetical protein|nr:hypothetical protein [Solirubrobacteraceae bacterium]